MMVLEVVPVQILSFIHWLILIHDALSHGFYYARAPVAVLLLPDTLAFSACIEMVVH